jgi:hypothetical protein
VRFSQFDPKETSPLSASCDAAIGRELTGDVGGAVAWPLAARAQQSKHLQRIGVLTGYPEADPDNKARLAGFLVPVRMVVTATKPHPVRVRSNPAYSIQ